MSEFLAAAPLWGPGAAAMAVLVLASGLFSSSETALFFLDREELRAMRSGSAGERIAARLMDDPNRVLTAILFWNLLINLTYFVIGVVVCGRLAAEGMSAAAGLFTAGGLAAVIVFGEVLPKGFAVSAGRGLASVTAFPLAFAVRVVDPVTPTLSAIAESVRRVFWPTLEDEPFLRAEDLERAVDALVGRREISAAERRTLHNALDLSEWRAEEAMRPRGSYVTRERPVTWESLDGYPPGGFVAIAGEGGRGRQGREGLGEVESIVPLRDVADTTKPLDARVVPLAVVPWCATLAQTLEEIGPRGAGAAVVDEYGATIGVLTLDDIVDTIFAADGSRARRVLQDDPIVPAGEKRWRVAGMVSLRKLGREIGVGLEADDDDHLTIGGMLADELDRVPEPGDALSYRGVTFEVAEATPKEVVRVDVVVPKREGRQ